MGSEYEALFETKEAQGRRAYRLFSGSVLVGISLILCYRVMYAPHAHEINDQQDESRRWEGTGWWLMFASELFFSIHWLCTVASRWNRVYRYTSKHILSDRYEEKLPGVDAFVCTADPTIEPPMMVISTVLSLMSYNYPPEKLTVYLSDDGGSDLTFYALLEASYFSKHWIPFCKKFNIEPRSPVAYFSMISSHPHDLSNSQEFLLIKKLYEEMKRRIETVTNLGRIPEEIRAKHKGFSEWDSVQSPRDHQTILQILIDGRDPNAVDREGFPLPSLVYLSREKRPKHPHNFKAGSMNALIRVSSNISNGSIILNVDCDMYSNNSESLRDALCILMDEQKGDEVAFVQYPQRFVNITKNDVYGSSLRIPYEVEFPGLDGYGGPLYIGTGCFHRRESLCGMKHDPGYKFEWKKRFERKQGSVIELEEMSRLLANCTYENGTKWGNEMGVRYGCLVEDVITGLKIQCRGWKSIYLNPKRRAFLGLPPCTLAETLVQQKRWAEGQCQLLLSKDGPFTNGFGRIKLGAQLGYCVYCLWAPSSLPTLCFLIVPPLCLLKGLPLFPKVSTLWFLPYAYVIIATNLYSLGEFLWTGGTLIGWWNDQRMWMFRRETSYFFGFTDTMLKLMGFSKSAFSITAKVVDEDVSQRYEKEIIEFGTCSPMFTIISTIALLNLFSMIWLIVEVLKGVISSRKVEGWGVIESMFLQVLLCSVVVLINLPVYEAMFFRKDKGRMPTSVSLKSTIFALLLCSIFLTC